MKPFYDPDHGDGWFTARHFAFDTVIGKKISHILFAVRKRWHFSWKNITAKKVKRLYAGPFEIEIGFR